MKIVFMGSPDFAVPSLQALAAAGHQVQRIICQADKPKGRGRKVQACAVSLCATELSVPLSTPAQVRGKAARSFLDEIEALQPDFIVVAAYGKILSTRLLRLPRFAPINVHASLLPRWRGASPIQHAVLAGDDVAGVSIMHMEAGLDTGPVYHQARLVIEPHETAGELSARLAQLGAQALVECLPRIASGELHASPQDKEGVTFAPLLRKTDGALDLTLSAQEIAQRVRAMNPWPGAYTHLSGEPLKVWRASPCDPPPGYNTAAPGTVLDTSAKLVVACGEQALAIEELQQAGRRRMAARQWLPGARLSPGAMLGSVS